MTLIARLPGLSLCRKIKPPSGRRGIAHYQLTPAHTLSSVRPRYPSRCRKSSELAREKTETLSAPFMRTVSQLPLAHQVRRNFAANWLSQLEFFWSAFVESDPICGGASNPWLSDREIDDIPGDHNSTAHQVAQWRQSGAR